MSMKPLSRFLSLLALSSFALGAGGCGDNKAIDNGDTGDDEHEHASTGATCPTTDAPTAQNFGEAFLDNYCRSCHSASVTGPGRGGAPTNTNFDTLEQVRTQSHDIDAHAAAGPIATNTEMPPRGLGLPTPTVAERQRLGQWLACGAP
jgi:uncharacterized membrane protein